MERLIPSPLLSREGNDSLKDAMLMPCEKVVDLTIGVSANTSACRGVSRLAKSLCRLWAVTGTGCLMIIFPRVCDWLWGTNVSTILVTQVHTTL